MTLPAVLAGRSVRTLASVGDAVFEQRVRRAALAAKKRKGERVGQIPYGFALGDDGPKLLELAAEQRLIVRVHALRRRGLGIVAIADKLNDDRVPARGTRWHRTTVHRILARAET